MLLKFFGLLLSDEGGILRVHGFKFLPHGGGCRRDRQHEQDRHGDDQPEQAARSTSLFFGAPALGVNQELLLLGQRLRLFQLGLQLLLPVGGLLVAVEPTLLKKGHGVVVFRVITLRPIFVGPILVTPVQRHLQGRVL